MGEGIIEQLIRLGSIAAALTGVGKILIGIYNNTVTKPQNRLSERIQEENTKQLTLSLKPLTLAIDRLNHLLEDSQRDREVLHEEVKKNQGKLEEIDDNVINHDKRITILEDRCDVRKGRN